MTEIETIIRAGLDRSYPAPESEPDWDDVLQRVSRTQQPPTRRLIRVDTKHGTGRRVTVGFVLAALAVAPLAFLVADPWNHGIDIVQRASAALDLKAGTVLQETLRSVQTDSSGRRVTFPVTQTWVSSNGNFRALFTLRRGGPEIEIGSGLASQLVPSTYDPATNTIQEACSTIRPNTDPATVIRKALTTGTVHIDGTTTINGHTVDRIQTQQDGTRDTIYIDAHTYLPVEAIGTTTRNGHLIRGVVSFTFTRLPATTANLKLASLSAEHPHAKASPLGLPCYG